MNGDAFTRRIHAWLMPRWLQRLSVQSSRKYGFLGDPTDSSFEASVLYFDVSAIARHDAGTGIQRMVRSVAISLTSAPPPGWTILPCAANNRRSYEKVLWPRMLGGSDESSVLDYKKGDVFLGLDFALDTIVKHKHQLKKMKKHGVRFWFVMYDLLPHQKPEWFSDKLVLRYQRWLQTIASLADGFFCISPAVAEDMRDYLHSHLQLPASLMPRLAVLPMGWDLEHAPHSRGIKEATHNLLQAMESGNTALMVGTLEPRKGHADILAAYDHLWQHGYEGRLVIAGRPGWKTEPLQCALRNHPLAGLKIFWLDNASDEEVQRLYRACTGVIVASHGEGFGLPLIEALGHGKPVLARDIPVFHTVLASGIRYFKESLESIQLSIEIDDWLSEAKDAKASSGALKLPSWDDTASEIISTLQDKRLSQASAIYCETH